MRFGRPFGERFDRSYSFNEGVCQRREGQWPLRIDFCRQVPHV